MKYLYLFFLITLLTKVSTNDLVFVLNNNYSVSSCEWIIDQCDVDYMTFWENNNSLTYNSSNKDIVNKNITSLNNLRYQDLELISNYDIPTLNYTYCVDYLCNENEKTTNSNNYRIVIIVISCILFILPVVAIVYLYKNKTQNRIVQRLNQENRLNFNNEYYYNFNQNTYFNNERFLNEDDDILYNHDHVYAENDFDQL